MTQKLRSAVIFQLQRRVESIHDSILMRSSNSRIKLPRVQRLDLGEKTLTKRLMALLSKHRSNPAQKDADTDGTYQDRACVGRSLSPGTHLLRYGLRYTVEGIDPPEVRYFLETIPSFRLTLGELGVRPKKKGRALTHPPLSLTVETGRPSASLSLFYVLTAGSTAAESRRSPDRPTDGGPWHPSPCGYPYTASCP